MKGLAEWLSIACAELGLVIDLGYKVALPNAPELTSVARIRNLGAPNGMLVFCDSNALQGHMQELIDADYGFSVLDEPTPGEAFDLQSFREMFADWGWSGEPGQQPRWL